MFDKDDGVDQKAARKAAVEAAAVMASGEPRLVRLEGIRFNNEKKKGDLQGLQRKKADRPGGGLKDEGRDVPRLENPKGRDWRDDISALYNNEGPSASHRVASEERSRIVGRPRGGHLLERTIVSRGALVRARRGARVQGSRTRGRRRRLVGLLLGRIPRTSCEVRWLCHQRKRRKRKRVAVTLVLHPVVGLERRGSQSVIGAVTRSERRRGARDLIARVTVHLIVKTPVQLCHTVAHSEWIGPPGNEYAFRIHMDREMREQ